MTLSLIDIHQKLEELESKFNEAEQVNKILSRQIKELFLLYDALKKLNKTRNHQDFFTTLTTILRKNFNVDEFSVFFYNPKLKILNIQFSNGIPKRNIKEFFYRAQESFVGRVFTSRSSLYLKDLSIYKNFNYYQMNKKVQGCIFYLPLNISTHETLGVLKLRKPISKSFSETDQSILNQLAEPLSLALKKAIAFDKIDRNAYIDELTGLYTKKYFENRFNAEIRRSQRYQHSLSVINLTITNFSELLRQCGKENGDLIIKEFSSFLQENVRMCDICFRYSTNQFLIMLPETLKSAAEEVITKVQKSWMNKEILLYDEFPASIKILSGFATYPIDTIEPPVLLKKVLESSELIEMK